VAIDQYHLIIAERELLDKTLKGSIRVMAEILSQVNPTAFSSASRVKRYVVKIARSIGLPSSWELSIAGFLSQIGCVTVPNEILEKVYSGDELSQEERAIFDSHPKAGARLLANIPRLGNIARMIALQRRPFHAYKQEAAKGPSDKLVYLGGQILKAAVDFDYLLFLGTKPDAAIRRMKEAKGEYNPKILEILAGIGRQQVAFTVKKLRLGQVLVGMELNQDLRAKNGLLLAKKGQEITLGLRDRLINFSKTIGIEEPFEVLLRT